MRTQHFYSTTTFKMSKVKLPGTAYPQNGEYFNGMVIAIIQLQ